jgi:hypothetical protein
MVAKSFWSFHWSQMRPNLPLNPEASPTALARRPLVTG